MFEITDTRISAIANCVPQNIIDNTEDTKLSNQIKLTGIKKRNIANQKSKIKTSDLCIKSAEQIFKLTKIKKSQIKFIIFVSQTRDYIFPSTACIIQEKLKLKKETICFDVPLGCSGFVYGLYLSKLISKNIKSSGLLLCGDMSSKFINYNDKSTSCLFGDAGSAILIEYKKNNKSLFSLSSDGSGFENIIMKHPNIYSSNNPKNSGFIMNGISVFQFAIKEIPKQINILLKKSNIKINEIDYFVFHQANKLIIKQIFSKLKINESKVLYSLDRYGNTNSSSIPMTINHNSNLFNSNSKILISGFGVGLSWGSAIINLNNTKMKKILYYEK